MIYISAIRIVYENNITILECEVYIYISFGKRWMSELRERQSALSFIKTIILISYR